MADVKSESVFGGWQPGCRMRGKQRNEGFIRLKGKLVEGSTLITLIGSD